MFQSYSQQVSLKPFCFFFEANFGVSTLLGILPNPVELTHSMAIPVGNRSVHPCYSQIRWKLGDGFHQGICRSHGFSSTPVLMHTGLSMVIFTARSRRHWSSIDVVLYISWTACGNVLESSQRRVSSFSSVSFEGALSPWMHIWSASEYIDTRIDKALHADTVLSSVPSWFSGLSWAASSSGCREGSASEEWIATW